MTLSMRGRCLRGILFPAASLLVALVLLDNQIGVAIAAGKHQFVPTCCGGAAFTETGATTRCIPSAAARCHHSCFTSTARQFVHLLRRGGNLLDGKKGYVGGRKFCGNLTATSFAPKLSVGQLRGGGQTSEAQYFKVGSFDPDVVLDVMTDTVFRKMPKFVAASTRLKRRKPPEGAKIQTTSPQKQDGQQQHDEEPVDRREHHHFVRKACVPHHIWETLHGNEFHLPEAVSDLSQTGLDVALDGPQSPAWKASRHTSKILKDVGGKVDTRNERIKQILENDVLVWTGKFDDGCYGCEAPVVKSRGIVGMSPKDLAELLMDSSKVKLYNTMSLGRTDLTIFQEDVDTVDGAFGHGETKIVRNRTKPPITKKGMEFVTLMHARKLSEENGEGSGYMVVSRAIGGKQAIVDAASHKDDHTAMGMVRSEILLGVNLLKNVEGEADKTDLTSITHVNSPAVPAFVAGKVSVKGAIDFIKDMRKLAPQKVSSD